MRNRTLVAALVVTGVLVMAGFAVVPGDLPLGEASTVTVSTDHAVSSASVMGGGDPDAGAHGMMGAMHSEGGMDECEAMMEDCPETMGPDMRSMMERMMNGAMDSMRRMMGGPGGMPCH